jgi:site-specific recombinase XerD
VRCVGKNRKHRSTPLTTEVVQVMRGWLDERGGTKSDPLFSTSRGRRLSTDAVALIIANHVQTATRSCPTLASKNVSPHVLRHTSAMRLLHAGVDTSTIALWLGHEQVQTTQIYVHADQTIKERALARTAPLGTAPGRYRPSDTLLAFLEQLR